MFLWNGGLYVTCLFRIRPELKLNKVLFLKVFLYFYEVR
jgi:hypothetical protein